MDKLMYNNYIHEYYNKDGETEYHDVTNGMYADDYFQSKLPTTVVYNLDENTEQHFSLQPQDALIAAFEQRKGNYNWWSYKNKEYYDIKCINNRTLILGSFTCVLK